MVAFSSRAFWVVTLFSGMATGGYADVRDRMSSVEGQVNDLRDRIEFMENSQSGGGVFSSEGGFSPQLGQMVARLQSIETTLQELRGEMERMSHQNRLLERDLAVFKADVETRFQLQQQKALALSPVVPKDAIGQLIEREESQEASASKEADPQKEKKAFEELQGLFKKNNFKEAGTLSRKFLKDYPQSAYTGAVTLLHGRCLAHQGQHQKAAAFLMKGYQKAPKSKKAPEILFHTAQSLAALKKKEESCAVLEKIQEDFPSLPGTLKASIQESMKKQKC